MRTREGTTATIVGVIVALIGYALYSSTPIWAAGIIGFGLAHIVLGVIDLLQNNNNYRKVRD
ncbi:MAG: asparagine synthase [Deltaproteobacteria bacterium]